MHRNSPASRVFLNSFILFKEHAYIKSGQTPNCFFSISSILMNGKPVEKRTYEVYCQKWQIGWVGEWVKLSNFGTGRNRQAGLDCHETILHGQSLSQVSASTTIQSTTQAAGMTSTSMNAMSHGQSRSQFSASNTLQLLAHAIGTSSTIMNDMSHGQSHKLWFLLLAICCYRDIELDI
ncbi:hypothetical protein Tco_1338584 [Tanacetum coccineum]